jgi:hypothetical protein
MNDQPGDPLDSIKVRAAFYVAKAAEARERAASSTRDSARASFIGVAQSYEALAQSIEAIAKRHKRRPIDKPKS